MDEHTIRTVLQALGFDLLYNKHQRIIENIKTAAQKGIQQQLDSGKTVKFSIALIHRSFYFINADLKILYNKVTFTIASFLRQYCY
jgi:hypothetical protein